jgi:hypothetical protein
LLLLEKVALSGERMLRCKLVVVVVLLLAQGMASPGHHHEGD